MKRSKRYKSQVKKIEPLQVYTLDEALTFVKQDPVKFDAGVELHVKLGIDPKKSEQIVRGTVVLPNGSGKTKRVAAFVGADKEAEAREAGADVIGTEEVIAEIKQTGKCNFDVAVATPDMMKKLGQIAKILGQQGLMPNPKTETVGPDIKKMVKELKGGKVAYRSDDGGNVHMLIGRVSFGAEQLKENIMACVESVRKAKPAEAKGVYMKTGVLASSMGPGIRFNIE
ncbi:MAG: 50S ribosomal protein L1 [Candidatus Kerfeldbacteria bacterium]|nr:50S ribosomal protein L1 [Candidatus Kerfeldbacteria bacterium]